VAAQAVTSSPADGYTLFVLAVGTAMSVALFKSLPFDAIKDFAPISSVAQFDMLMMTKSSSPIRTLDDLMAMARERDDKKDRATTLPGSSQFMAGALFRSVTNPKITRVPFRTTPDVFIAVLRGDVDVVIESYGALRSAIDSGAVRPLVSTGKARSLPNVPTGAESGLRLMSSSAAQVSCDKSFRESLPVTLASERSPLPSNAVMDTLPHRVSTPRRRTWRLATRL
jgi:tripartite-type tricarboxylate transporter receptor subunit TctC